MRIFTKKNMPTDNLTYQQSGYFTKIIIDYLNQDETVKLFYNRFPTLENFKYQIKEKTANYLNKNRIILSSTIKNQYHKVDTAPLVNKNILLLADENTFTITTGHQLNLFTGPLYFLYKIISTINLCKQLKATYPKQNFVPIYWMATEDHDFEEINYFNYKNKKIKWSKTSNGPVGRLSTSGLQDVLKVFETQLGTSTNAKYLINVFEKSYLNHQNLAAATRYLANELFKNDGLVIIDADSKPLKKLFITYFKQELLQQSSYTTVTETNNQLINYSIQVNPREINLFYIENNLRERIIFDNGNFKINNTKIIFSSQEILNELENFPEKFSPNVLLRPLYQEVILPNLAYIGGGGELAYWLQLKATFKLFTTTFPMLVLRNSALLISEKQFKKMTGLHISVADLFLKNETLLSKKATELSHLPIDFTSQKETLKNQFELLINVAQQTDKTFIGAVKAQEIKQLRGLLHLEKRLLKAEKRVYKETLSRISDLQEELFPGQSLQERKQNFSEFFVDYGFSLIAKISDNLNPLSPDFSVIYL